jgi:hypothetical protein
LLCLDSPTKNRVECIPVVRIERIDYRSHDEQINKSMLKLFINLNNLMFSKINVPENQKILPLNLSGKLTIELNSILC